MKAIPLSIAVLLGMAAGFFMAPAYREAVRLRGRRGEPHGLAS